jgi:hypothetical protein
MATFLGAVSGGRKYIKIVRYGKGYYQDQISYLRILNIKNKWLVLKEVDDTIYFEGKNKKEAVDYITTYNQELNYYI